MVTTNNPARAAKANAQSAKASNEQAAEAAKNDPTIAAAQSNSGSTGTYGAEGVEKTEARDKDSYIVKDGDSVESVAEEAGMEPVELLALNPELAGGRNFLYTGQEIRLK